MRYGLEDEEIIVGLQKMQRHDVVKIGCIKGMMDKAHLQEWKIFLRISYSVLNWKPLIFLQAKKSIMAHAKR